jgi:hypothetical protein
MSVATKPNITPTRRSALGFSAAAIIAGMTTPVLAAAPLATAATQISELHRQYRDTAARHAAMDEALLKLPAGPEHDAMHKAFVQALDDCLALQARILALQAETLEDAAIQVTLCYYLADAMDPHPTEEEVSELSQQMRTALASIMLVVGKTGGADIDRFGWGDMRRLCDRHGPAGRAQA